MSMQDTASRTFICDICSAKQIIEIDSPLKEISLPMGWAILKTPIKMYHLCAGHLKSAVDIFKLFGIKYELSGGEIRVVKDIQKIRSDEISVTLTGLGIGFTEEGKP